MTNAQKLIALFGAGLSVNGVVFNAGILERTYSNPPKTLPLSDWFALGDASIIWGECQKIETGQQIGVKTGRAVLPVTELNNAIASSAEFFTIAGGDVLTNIRAINGDMVNMEDPVAVGNIRKLLAAYPDALDKFNALTIADASINDGLFGGLLTMDDVNLAISGG